ncbi:hypothetical protein A1O3_08377 [Capronia epimyces CBS 606.96]|uniref:Trafficking protein particle complex subunit 10 n=1 Tax=Capronia epimyces CBS 606.96 TaxID=1182542 RepID=W9XSW9_9EURO|nr:uncharacterized protein A1O3_08377 [Capronia epimyces CBS 606.96]EXJ80091.1 hypothetical protein A1O3_08377 [Capronia epimyces CBS 606.96]
MDGTEPPSTSKVIVQCVDPHNLYDFVEPHLSARSPLRNLHWKSPNRPLRSIPYLNVSITREDTSAGSQSHIRRHQIPGLRQTPYVKLYLLRCDDKETYKERARKEVRQWVKAQASTIDGKPSGKAQEDHDAFEWLIVHVVLPNTPAATQPKSAKHISLETTDSTDSINSKSKWSGKSSSTILDKLRADFNSISKSSINRVAQVRLVEPNVKSTALAPADLEEQWQELVESLKACILRSFDARVAQYEGDIRERDSQRNLPGWNFCTFFVLKEGLAKGFESVGLLDDALAIYDELSLGLDGLVKEQVQRIDHDDSGALLRFSKETKDLLRAALDPQSSSASTPGAEVIFSLEHILNDDRNEFPFDADRKNYLGLILSNEVSALDLRIYLFTRQMEMLLRQGQANISKSAHSAKPAADLNVIANLTERAIQSINLIARNLRLELYNAWGGQEGLSPDELHSQSTVTGNIVSTWEWRACMQVLSRVLPTLGIDRGHGTVALSLDAVELSLDIDKRSPSQSEADRSPQRMSSAIVLHPPPHENSQEHSKRVSLMSNSTIPRHHLMSRPGSEQLALWISRLVMLARHAMESLEITRPWVVEMKQIAMNAGIIGNSQANGRVDEEFSSADDPQPRKVHQESTAGLGSKTLQAATASQSTFSHLYALLSVLAYRTAVDAKNHATAKQILTNLAEMEYRQGNQTIVARYLHSLLGPLPRPSCRPIDGYLLRIYADCLGKLERTNEYARCLISYLYWASRCPAGTLSTTCLATNQSYVDRLFEVAPTLAATTLPLTTLFHVSSVSRTISKLEGRDGFAMSIVIHSLAGTSTPPLENIKMRLVSKDGSEPRFLTLKLRGESSIEAGGTNILLETSVTTHGWYTPDEVELHLGNLRFLHHFLKSHEEEFADPDESALPRSNIAPVLVYPFFQSLEVRITPSPHIHLAQIRRLLVKIRPGANEVKQCKLRLKTATAGLRLNIHDARWLDGTRRSVALRTAREGDALILVVDELKSGSLTEVEIPYTTEVPSEPSVILRVDANYETSQGVFTLYDTAFINVILPVTINVQDIYRSGYMYSRFTAIPATLVPLHLVNCYLEDNEAYMADAGHGFPEPLVVFPKQPASWTARLVPKHEEVLKSTQRMTLSVDFQSLDEVMLAALEESFTSAILKTRYAYTARLLVTHLRNRIRAVWTEQDLEVAGLSQEVEIWNFQDMNWFAVLCAFDRQLSAEIEGWLQMWHADTKPLRLTKAARQRQLKLYVDISPPPVVVMAAIESSRLHTATLGQPLAAELVISLGNQREKEVEAAFEVAAPTDSWLIGGRRKGNVQLTRQPARIPIVLFPQHLGHALLPIITVKCRKWVKADGSGGEGWAEVPCEVHNTTHGRSILVTPGLRSTTVEVFGAGPDEGTGRLISSQSR